MKLLPTIEPFFRWYDLWIGAYWDRDKRHLYVCPLPTLGVKIAFPARPLKPGDRARWDETDERVTVTSVEHDRVWVKFDDSDQTGWVPRGELHRVD